MSARQLDIFTVLGQQRAVRGPQETGEATFTFIEGDTYRLRLHAQRPVTDLGSADRFTPATFSEFVAFEAALGQVDAAPTGGTWKIKRTGGAFSSALAFNAAPAQVKAAIEALSGIGANKVEVTNGNAAHIYIVRPVNPADDYTFETESSLVPLCTARVRKGSDGSGSYTVLKLHKAYFAFADQWEFTMPPEVAVASERTGSSVKNATQLITIPDGAMGSFELQHSGVSTRTIAVDGITAAAVELALNELFADGATAPRFRCFDAGANAIQVECIGALAKQAVPTLGIELYGQVPLPTPEADFALTELPMELFIAAKDKLKLTLDIVGIDGDGNEHTLVLREAEIRNSLIDRGTSATIGAVSTRYVEVTSTVDPEAPIQVGFRSTTKVTTGSGSTGTPGAYTDTFTHDLNTRFPYIIAFRLISVSPEKWEQVDDNEFTVETISLTQSKVQFTTIPPVTGNVGSIKIVALNPEAGVWTNDHEHTTDEVNGVGADSAKTLTEIITELRAAMPDGWPSVPGSALADASVTADKLELASLIKALFADAAFLAGLRDLATDSTFVKTLLETMSASTSLSEFAKAIAATISTDRTVAEEWMTMFREIEGFDVFLRELLLSSLSGVTSLPLGTVIFDIPPFEFIYPPAQEIPAPATISDVVQDIETTTVAGSTTTKTTGKTSVAKNTANAVVSYDLLSPAVVGFADGGGVHGELSPTAAAQRYTATSTASAKTAGTRRGRSWKAGTKLTRANGHWFEVREDGTTLWPVEMESDVSTITVTADMLHAQTKLSCDWLLQAQLAGNAIGTEDFVIEICDIGGAIIGSGVSASTPIWTPICSQSIALSRTNTLHQFGLTITRTTQPLPIRRQVSGSDGDTEFEGDVRGLEVGMKVVCIDFPPGTTITSILDPESDNGTFTLSHAKLASGDPPCVFYRPLVGKLTRYGVETTFEVVSPTFELRARVEKFTCQTLTGTSEEKWRGGLGVSSPLQARGSMQLKVATPTASIVPLTS
jgi:hypothetical protein